MINIKNQSELILLHSIAIDIELEYQNENPLHLL